jgi:hypothetical protein
VTNYPVGVFEDKYDKGADSINHEGLPVCDAVSLELAMQKRWASDAHFVTYCPSVEADMGWFRINKTGTVLSEIRALGHDIFRTLIVVDWDTPEHLPWDESSITQERYAELYDAAAKKLPILDNWRYWYWTAKGARIVFVLDEPIPADLSEPKVRWLLTSMRSQGVGCDLLTDWSRLYRLPKVYRYDSFTDTQPYFDIYEQPRRVLKSEDLMEIGVADALRTASIGQHTDPMPETSELVYLVENPDGTPTHFAKQAKKRLKNRECYDCLFAHGPLAPVGRRDNTLTAYVGQAASLLYGIPSATKEHVLALFMPAIADLEPDQDTPCWITKAWSLVGRLWEQEAAKHREQQAKEAEQVEQVGTIVSGMREWCIDRHELFSDEEIAMEWASRRMIVSADKHFFLMRPDGYYRPQPLHKEQLIPAIRASYPDLIPTVTMNDKGETRDKSVLSIINRHATVVSKVKARPEMRGGTIENIDSHQAALIIPSFCRNHKLVPKHDETVDLWLCKVFGAEVERAKAWIAWALAFEEGPTCALSLVGPPGIGKKMLVRGLAECLEIPSVASDADISGQYQYGLLESPFVAVNEGWSNNRSGKHPADMFRELTGGDEITVQRKYMPPVSVSNPARVIFTANNYDVIRVLADKRNLTPEDREALAIRLLHMTCDRKAQKWLEDNGGMFFTRGWIAPDAGKEPSQYKVARHFLYLHANRRNWPRGNRLLVEGEGSQRLMEVMETQTGVAPEVIETLASMISSPARRPGYMLLSGNRICVVPSEVVHHWRTKVREHRNIDLRNEDVRNVVKSLSVSVADPRQAAYSELLGDVKHASSTWYELDVLKIYKAAREAGWPVDKIKGLVKQG